MVSECFFILFYFFQVDFEAISGLSGKNGINDVVVWGGTGARVGNGVICAKYLPSILVCKKKASKTKCEEVILKCKQTWPQGVRIMCGVFPASSLCCYHG